MSDSFYHFYKNQLLNIDYERLKEIIGPRDVYVWGASIEGLRIFGILTKVGINVKGFIDNSIEKIDDGDVYKPDEILNNGPKYCFVIISVSLKFESELSAILAECGFVENEDYFYPYKNMSYVIKDLVPRRNVTCDKRFKLGETIAESLNDDVMYFILMGGHIGDEALALSWIKAYKEKHFVKKLIILTTLKYEGLSRLYIRGDDEIQVWDKDRLDALRVYSLSNTRNKLNLIGANWC
ncbi:hypothetical protein, partial [Butyrivibrio fibrisolvens]|uniref:hypothetical protein n=1 Tax=Butyrivibrio fibrisolvens TaxID=831 RepID=UPI00048843C8